MFILPFFLWHIGYLKVLFNFHIFGTYLFIITHIHSCFELPNFISLWSQNILCIIPLFYFFNCKFYFISLHIVCPGLSYVHFRRKCLLLLWDGMFYHCQFKIWLVYNVIHVLYLHVDLLLCCSSPYWKWSIEDSKYFCRIVCLIFNSVRFCFTCFGGLLFENS